MRIATGGISHETSTFAPTPTTLADFKTGLGLFRGQAILERFRGTNNCTGGFIAGAERHGFELVPLLWTFAYPGGLIARSDYEALKIEFIERLTQVLPVDGVLLDLHGAMVVEGIDDGDGDFLDAVRHAVGPDCPVIATFDLHGNHTQRRLDAATAVIGFDTYPHVDMAERGQEAADLMVRTIRGEVRPVMAFRELPLFWSAASQVTGHPPIDEAFRLVHEVERRPGILSVTLATGFPWADVPQMGASVIVVADGNPQLARAAADEIGDWIWQRRERWHRRPLSVPEALDLGERAGRFPIMLADMADNTGGGAGGDSTEVLRTFVERDLQGALLLYLVDPEVARAAHRTPIGYRMRVAIGGKSHPLQGPPLPLDVEVVALSNGKFTYDGPMYAGLTGDLGLSAWLRHCGVNVVVVSARMQPLDQAFARSLGIDCAAMKYIAVKSAVHFRSGFETIAGSIHNIDAQAIHTHDFARLTYQRRRRPMFPLDAIKAAMVASTPSGWDYEIEAPALTPELIQQTADALTNAADGIEAAHVTGDDWRVFRWAAHGARAALRLAEAGHRDFFIFANMRSTATDCQTQSPIAQQYRGRPPEWSGFKAAAIVLVRMALAWYPHKFPPGTIISEDGPVMHDVQIAYRAIADKLGEEQADKPPLGDGVPTVLAETIEQAARKHADGPTMEGLFFVDCTPYKFGPLQWRLLKALYGRGSVAFEAIGDVVWGDSDWNDGRLRKLASDTNGKLLVYKLRFEIISPMDAHYMLQKLPLVTPEVTGK